MKQPENLSGEIDSIDSTIVTVSSYSSSRSDQLEIQIRCNLDLVIFYYPQNSGSETLRLQWYSWFKLPYFCSYRPDAPQLALCRYAEFQAYALGLLSQNYFHCVDLELPKFVH